jgi:predicted RNase H-like nuclease
MSKLLPRETGKAIVAGVDGCKSGWFCITKDLSSSDIGFVIFSDSKSLLKQQPEPSIIAIDIPIGLTETGPRVCDVEARKLLGPRKRSVFPAPIRPALQGNTRKEADSIGRRVDGRGVSAQAFSIYDKIRDLDDILSVSPQLQNQIKEIHPELCFWAWNDKQPMPDTKKSEDGETQRRALISKLFGTEVVDRIRSEYKRSEVATDDIHDAFAALWTAERIVRGVANVIPDPPPKDKFGLAMEMWC